MMCQGWVPDQPSVRRVAYETRDEGAALRAAAACPEAAPGYRRQQLRHHRKIVQAGPQASSWVDSYWDGAPLEWAIKKYFTS